jgi:hypothetical protein
VAAGRLKATSAANYVRALRRIVAYAAQRGDDASDLAPWIDRYAADATAGRIEAPASDLVVGRAAFNRLLAFASTR